MFCKVCTKSAHRWPEDAWMSAQDFLECTKNSENFVKVTITGDESWVYGYNPEASMF